MQSSFSKGGGLLDTLTSWMLKFDVDGEMQGKSITMGIGVVLFNDLGDMILVFISLWVGGTFGFQGGSENEFFFFP